MEEHWYNAHLGLLVMRSKCLILFGRHKNRRTSLGNLITVKRLIKRSTLTRSNAALRSILAMRAKLPESSALLIID